MLRDKVVGSSPKAAALSLTSRIKPIRLGRRVAEQVEVSDFRGATISCRRAIAARRTLGAPIAGQANGTDEEQRLCLRQLLVLVDDLRIQQRRSGRA